MSHSFCYRRRVEFRDTDAAGLVHFSVFFNYMEEAEHALLRHLDLQVVASDSSGDFSFPRVAAQCDYRSPLRFGDEVNIDVTVAKLGRSSIAYRFEFLLDGQCLAAGDVTVVCCRLSDQGPPHSMPLPQTFAQKLSEFVS